MYNHSYLGSVVAGYEMSEKPCPHGHTRRSKCYICDYEDDQEEMEQLQNIIAELENRLNTALLANKSLEDAFEGKHKRIAELEAQLAEAQKKVDRYRDALSDIQEHQAQETADCYSMQEIADAAMESE